MRNNQPITQHERVYPAEQRLITTTNLKGIITYRNEAFIDISGFSREELMSAPHNLIRHPDVLPAVFAHMWTTLKAGRPWMGIVKNCCKNGDHYWSAPMSRRSTTRRGGRLRVGAGQADRRTDPARRGPSPSPRRRQAGDPPGATAGCRYCSIGCRSS